MFAELARVNQEVEAKTARLGWVAQRFVPPASMKPKGKPLGVL